MATESRGSSTVDSRREEHPLPIAFSTAKVQAYVAPPQWNFDRGRNRFGADRVDFSDRVASGCKRNFPRGTQPRTRVGRVCMRRKPRGSSERAKYVSSRPVQGTTARQDVKEIIVSRKCLSLAEKTDDRVLEVSLPSSVQLRTLSFFSLCPPPPSSILPLVLLTGSVRRTGTTFTVCHGKRHWEETEGDSPPADFMVLTGETAERERCLGWSECS